MTFTNRQRSDHFLQCRWLGNAGLGLKLRLLTDRVDQSHLILLIYFGLIAVVGLHLDILVLVELSLS